MTNLRLPASQDNDMLDFVGLKESISSELKFINGSYYCTIRGLSRLLDVSPSSFTDTRRQVNGAPMGLLLKVKECSVEELPESLKPIAGFDFKDQLHVVAPNTHVNLLLPEVVISCITKYYAYDCQKKRHRAIQFDNLFSAVGVRSFFKELLESPNDVTVIKESSNVSNEVDNRISAVKEVMSVLADTSPEFKEKALLTLLGVL